jgi:hypothetical protein
VPRPVARLSPPPSRSTIRSSGPTGTVIFRPLPRNCGVEKGTWTDAGCPLAGGALHSSRPGASRSHSTPAEPPALKPERFHAPAGAIIRPCVPETPTCHQALVPRLPDPMPLHRLRRHGEKPRRRETCIGRHLPPRRPNGRNFHLSPPAALPPFPPGRGAGYQGGTDRCSRQTFPRTLDCRRPQSDGAVGGLGSRTHSASPRAPHDPQATVRALVRLIGAG